MKKVHKYFYYILTFFFLLGCSSSGLRNYQSLSGNWHSVLRSDQIYFAGNKYNFEFHNDSFKVRMESWTDELTYQPWDPCNKLNHAEFAAGIFEIDNNEIFFNGMFTDSMFNVIKRGCFRLGKYEEKYDYYFHGDSIYLGKYKYDNDVYDMSSEIILKRGKE